jgi:hypothetical protein
MRIDPSLWDNGAAFAMFTSMLLSYGAMLAYLGTLLFSLPCALIMLDKGRLNFVNVMVATVLLALVYCLVLNVILIRIYTFIPNVVAWSVFAVIVSGLCFYLIGVWTPCKKQ